MASGGYKDDRVADAILMHKRTYIITGRPREMTDILTLTIIRRPRSEAASLSSVRSVISWRRWSMNKQAAC
eukprot:scaffold145761_cov17-Prasinocladus_malaysianus.AAC.1